MKKIVNPFRYLPLRQALCWGVVALILTAIFNWQLGLRATSLTQFNYGGGALWVSTVHQIVVWLLFALVLYAAGVIASKSKVRFGDVAAYNLFARIPFDLSLLIFAVPSVKSIMGYLSDGNVNAMVEYATPLTLIGLFGVIFSVWYFFWTYKAFAEATNLKNAKGVVIFFLCYVLSYTASNYLLRLIA